VVVPRSSKQEKRGITGVIPEIEAEYAQNMGASQVESALNGAIVDKSHGHSPYQHHITPFMTYPFIKMHGLGNDFVVLDARKRDLNLSLSQARSIADRRTGVGCDQLIVLEPSDNADVFMRIRNPDGGEAEACGNATRCVASQLMAENCSDRVVIETVAGLLEATDAGHGLYSVDMGPANLDWDQIPLARDMDTLHVEVQVGPDSAPVLADPVAVNIGNPHAVFFVDNVDAVDLATVGPMLEHHPVFPERANISIAQIISNGAIRMRVWERTAGITRACGSAACAVLVAAARRGLTGRGAEVTLDGGTLKIAWREDGHVMMTGPVATSFAGNLSEELMGGTTA
jgi:diaminopimelate epimerase